MWHDKALALLLAAFSTAVAFGGCGSKSNGTGADNGGEVFTSSGGPGFGGSSSGTSVGVTCTNGMGWACRVNNSCGSGSTTLTGKVYDPAGKNPIYNVVVWVPNDASQLPAITPGTNSCNTCDASIGDYVVATTTDATGSFTLTGVPTGKGVPSSCRSASGDVWWPSTRPTVRRRPSPRERSGSPEPERRQHAADGPPHGRLRQPRLLHDEARHRREGVLGPHGGGRLDIYQGLNSPLDVRSAMAPGCRAARRATARTRRARSGRPSRASSPTTSSSWPARAARPTQTKPAGGEASDARLAGRRRQGLRHALPLHLVQEQPAPTSRAWRPGWDRRIGHRHGAVHDRHLVSRRVRRCTTGSRASARCRAQAPSR